MDQLLTKEDKIAAVARSHFDCDADEGGDADANVLNAFAVSRDGQIIQVEGARALDLGGLVSTKLQHGLAVLRARQPPCSCASGFALQRS